MITYINVCPISNINMSDTYTTVKVEPNKRKLTPSGPSTVITIPPEWLRFTEKKLERKLEDVTLILNSVIIVVPDDKEVPIYKEFLIYWEKLNGREKSIALREIKKVKGRTK